MDYGSLIREAWSTTWHHRFLWVLGLFTGAAVGTCTGIGNRSPVQYQTQSRDLYQALPSLEGAATDAGQWLASHVQLVAVGVFLLVALGLVFLVISFIAQGGITEATIDLARHQPTSLGQAWRVGRHFFWRFVGLALVPTLVAIVLATLVGTVVVVAIGTSAMTSGTAQTGVIALWIVVGLVAAALLIPFAIAFSIVLTYAQRAIVADNVGAIAAIRSGWGVLRRHVGDSFLVWLITVGLAIAANLAIVVAIGVVGVILVGIGLILWSAIGFTAITGIYVGLGVVAIIAVAWGLEAIANVFLWDFWTLAYLRLTLAAPEPTR
jgi:hypothetical protein